MKNSVVTFSGFGLLLKFTLLAKCLRKYHIWEHFGCWVMCRNAIGQSGYSILKLVISRQRNDQLMWFFAYW